MISFFKNHIARITNRIRRFRGPALRDQCASVIMRTCSLQLEREEVRELAPIGKATGPMLLSGGAITQIRYRVFDRNADAVDPTIKEEPWRAFAEVQCVLTLERDPEFTVKIESHEIEPRSLHQEPGLALVRSLSQYFPLLPKAYLGPVIKPGEAS